MEKEIKIIITRSDLRFLISVLSNYHKNRLYLWRKRKRENSMSKDLEERLWDKIDRIDSLKEALWDIYVESEE